MTIKKLFDKGKTKKVKKSESIQTTSKEVESKRHLEVELEEHSRFVPHVDFATASHFAVYGLAEKYYVDSVDKICSQYPYDGSLYEKSAWDVSASYVDKWIFENKYPRTAGHISMSADGWGTLTTGPTTLGYGKSSDPEYISLFGGPHTASGGMIGKSLKSVFSGSNLYNTGAIRQSNLAMDLEEGVTVEFWLKKDQDSYKPGTTTQKEVIFDLWNGEDTSSVSYGRLRIELTSSFLDGVSTGPGTPFLVTAISGASGAETGYDRRTIGQTLTTASTDDWSHYAFVFKNDGSDTTTKLYVNGFLNDSFTVSSEAPQEVTGGLRAHIGALVAPVRGDTVAVATYGKLNAALDEFRYWKTARSSKDIGRHWFTQVGGGTNTDNWSDTRLGVYYKFNEGVTTSSSLDSTVLDYSGRITNGSWVGYPGSNARKTTSAMELAGATTSEFKDPIVYPFHPTVKHVREELRISGSLHDVSNPACLINKFPEFMIDQDATIGGDNLKNVLQILGTYLDTLHMQIKAVSELKDTRYIKDRHKPYPFASELLDSKGLMPSEIFVDSTVLERIMSRDEGQEFSRKITDVKNLIYQNIHNNLNNIYKKKGTSGAIRNIMNCFGIGEDVIKLNIYADHVDYEFRDNRKYSVARKKYIDFNHPNRFHGTVYQSASAGNPNAVSYISGTIDDGFENNLAFTMEAEAVLPKKIPPTHQAHFRTLFTSSSVAGFHAATSSAILFPDDDIDMRIYAIRYGTDSDDAYFQLTGSSGIDLKTDLYRDVYNNEKWNFAVRLKPSKYPLVNGVTGSATTSSTAPTGIAPPGTTEDIPYDVEFYGINAELGTISNEFKLSTTVTNADGKKFLRYGKRLYAGAHRDHFTGSLLEYSDVKVGAVRYWLNYLDDQALRAHAFDIENYGTVNPYKNTFLNPTQLKGQYIPQTETLALHWDFETVTGSDTAGQFVVEDASSGTLNPDGSYGRSAFGWYDDVVGRQHTAVGDLFLSNETNVVDKDYIHSGKQQLPEFISSDDMVNILRRDDDIFTQDSRPVNYYFAIEKSMYQTVSEEILKIFATIVDFNNLVGEPVNRYRMEYKDMAKLRQLFFERIGNTPDLDKYMEFYRWLDSSISDIIEEFIPATANYSDDVRNIIESHVLERNKYLNKYPTLEGKDSYIEGVARGISELSYNWRLGHAPIGSFSTKALQLKQKYDRIYIGEVEDWDAKIGRTSAGGTSKFTFSMWLNPQNFGPPADVIGDAGLERGWLWSFANDFYVHFYDVATTSDSIKQPRIRVNFKFAGPGSAKFKAPSWDSVPKLNEWNHIVVAYDATSTSNYPVIYVNGTEWTRIADGTSWTGDFYGFQGTTFGGGDNCYIGGRNANTKPITWSSTADRTVHAIYDEVSIWKTNLDASAISELYNSGQVFDIKTHSEVSNLVSWWRMGERAAKVTEDNPTIIDEMRFKNAVVYGDIGGGGKFRGNFVTDTAPGIWSHPTELGAGSENVVFWRNRALRTEIPLTSSVIGVDSAREIIRRIKTTEHSGSVPILSTVDGTKYSGSVYSLRNLVRTRKLEIDYRSSPSMNIHGGINNDPFKNRQLTYDATYPHGPLDPETRLPRNVLLSFAEDVQPLTPETVKPNQKRKHYFKVTHGRDYGADYYDGTKNSLAMPFSIHSSTVKTGYNRHVHEGFRPNVELTNLHFDVTTHDGAIPMQGPFTEMYVGGHQSRHQRINQGSDSPLNRAEAWRVLVGDCKFDPDEECGRTMSRSAGTGAIAVVGADYPPPDATADCDDTMEDIYPYRQHARATYFRDEFAKRPLNIRNIQQKTGSTIIGNYTRNYEVIHTVGRKENNIFFKENAGTPLPNRYDKTTNASHLPETTNPLTLMAVKANTGDTHAGNKLGNSFIPAPAADVFGPGASWSLRVNYLNNTPHRYSNVHELPKRGEATISASNRTVIASRFSAPGGPEVMTRGFLDIASEEYSVYNALPWRNLGVRGPVPRMDNGGATIPGNGIPIGGSGEGMMTMPGETTTSSGTMRMENHLTTHEYTVGKRSTNRRTRDGLHALLTRHCGQFGHDLKYGSVTALDYVELPSYHKVNRNGVRRPRLTGEINYFNTKAVLWDTSLGTSDSTSDPVAGMYFGESTTWDALIGTGAGSKFSISAWVANRGNTTDTDTGAASRLIDFSMDNVAIWVSGHSSGKARINFVTRWRTPDADDKIAGWRTVDRVLPYSSDNETFNNITVTYDATHNRNVPRVYIDGNEYAVESMDSYPQPPDGSIWKGIVTDMDCYIGCVEDGVTEKLRRSFNGLIADLAIWDDVLIPAEVGEIINGHPATSVDEKGPYNLNMHSANTSLVAWYRMGDGVIEDGNQDNISDSSTNDRIYNMATRYKNQYNAFPTDNMRAADIKDYNLGAYETVEEAAFTDYDNWYVSRPIPGSTSGYSWISASAITIPFGHPTDESDITFMSASDFGSYVRGDGYDYRIFGETQRHVTLSSSVREVGHKDSFMPSVSHLNLNIYENMTSSTGHLGPDVELHPSSSYGKGIGDYPSHEHSAHIIQNKALVPIRWGGTQPRMSEVAMFNALMWKRGNQYGFNTWKQIRGGEHVIARKWRKTSQFPLTKRPETIFFSSSITGRRPLIIRRGGVVTYPETVITSKYKPIKFNVTIEDDTSLVEQEITMKASFVNDFVLFDNDDLMNEGGFKERRRFAHGYNDITDLYLNGAFDRNETPIEDFNSLEYKEVVFPAVYNMYSPIIRERPNFRLNAYHAHRDVRNDIAGIRNTTHIRGTPANDTANLRARHYFPSQSCWPLDAQFGFMDSLPITCALGLDRKWVEATEKRTMGEIVFPGKDCYSGELQNSYTLVHRAKYRVQDTELRLKSWNGVDTGPAEDHEPVSITTASLVIPGAVYNRRHTLCSTASVVCPTGMPIPETGSHNIHSTWGTTSGSSAFPDAPFGRLVPFGGQALWEANRLAGFLSASVIPYSDLSASSLTLTSVAAPFFGKVHMPTIASPIFNGIPRGQMRTSTFAPIFDGLKTNNTFFEEKQDEIRHDFVESARQPHPDNYGQWADEIRPHNKAFSIIPEFRISQHMQFYLSGSETNFMKENPRMLGIYGAYTQEGAKLTSEEPDFFRTYSMSDFLKYFDIVESDHKGFIEPSGITLQCRALMKFMPYKGFYPAERAIQLSRQFSKSYKRRVQINGPNVITPKEMLQGQYGLSRDWANRLAGNMRDFYKGSADFRENIDRTYQSVHGGFRVFHMPFFSPGIMFNSIKSGMAVDWPVQESGSGHGGPVWSTILEKTDDPGWESNIDWGNPPGGNAANVPWEGSMGGGAAASSISITPGGEYSDRGWIAPEGTDPGVGIQVRHGKSKGEICDAFGLSLGRVEVTKVGTTEKIISTNPSLKKITGIPVYDVLRHPVPFSYRVPFEAIIEPDKYVTGRTLIDTEPNVACALPGVYARYRGGANPLYKLMAHNFFAAVPDFWLPRGRLTSLKSKPENKLNLNLTSGSVYYARVKLYRSMNRDRDYGEFHSRYYVTNLGQDFPVPQDPTAYFDLKFTASNVIQPHQLQETMTMYSRPTAFGPPAVGRSFTQLARGEETAASGTADGAARIADSFEGYNWTHTPPYYNGEAWADIIVPIRDTKKHTIQELMDLAYVNCTRIEDTKLVWTGSMETMLRARDGHPALSGAADIPGQRLSGANGIAMQANATLNLFGLERVNSVTYNAFTGQPMTVTDDPRQTSQRWVIQPKWETPHYNFNNLCPRPITQEDGTLTVPNDDLAVSISASIPRGMWHQFGTLPHSDDTGIFMQIDDIPEVWLRMKCGEYTRHKTIPWLAHLTNSLGDFNTNVDGGGVRGRELYGASDESGGGFTWAPAPSTASTEWPTAPGAGEAPSDLGDAYAQRLDPQWSFMFDKLKRRIYGYSDARQQGTILAAIDHDRAFSLKTLLGFSDEAKKLGKTRKGKRVFEAVVAVPFIEEDGERQFFKIPKRTVATVLGSRYKGTAAPFKSDRMVGRSVRRQIRKMQKYVFPPTMDFINNPDEVDPFACYIFEFTHVFDQTDLSYMWQNLAPDFESRTKKRRSTVSHDLLEKELMGYYQNRNNEALANKVQWLVFKVKQKGTWNYWNTIADQRKGSSNPQRGVVGPGVISTFEFDNQSDRNEPTVIGPNVTPKYSYNWPYDYFSMIEFVQMSAEVEFSEIEDDAPQAGGDIWRYRRKKKRKSLKHAKAAKAKAGRVRAMRDRMASYPQPGMLRPPPPPGSGDDE